MDWLTWPLELQHPGTEPCWQSSPECWFSWRNRMQIHYWDKLEVGISKRWQWQLQRWWFAPNEADTDVDIGQVPFPSQSRFVWILFCSHPNSNKVITTKFCTCHDSCAVVACAKVWCDIMTRHGITTKQKFPSNLHCDDKTVTEMIPRSKPTYLPELRAAGSCRPEFGGIRRLDWLISLINISLCCISEMYKATLIM